VEELRIGDGAIEAVILPEAGARLHRLRAFGHDLLRTPDDPATHTRDPFFWGAYVMAPWCNRMPAEPITVDDRTVAVAPNFVDGSAIHGQVYASTWERNGETLGLLGGGDGWPWSYELSMRVVAEESSLRVTLAVTNRSADPMPAGLGLHPWWRRPVRLRVPGAAVYPSNLEADAVTAAVSGRFDLRRLAPAPGGLDGTWTYLGGESTVLGWPELGLEAELLASSSLDHVAVATPVDLDAIAVEPQTHAPGGLIRMLHGQAGGMTRLSAGATLEASIEVRVARVQRMPVS
jgi:aldose 1-epimerase